jgi:opacity protein-like surface antigen
MQKQSLTKAASCAVLLAAAAGPVAAQSSDWTVDLSANLWFNDSTVTADTPQGETSAELSFSDAIQDLDFAFMGTVEARNGPWSVIGDLLYFRITASGDTPNGVLFSGVDTRSEITVVSTYLTYRVYQDASMAFDIGAGARAFWTSLDTTFIGAGAPTETFSQDKDWIDPVVAARARFAFNESWFGTLMFDAGGTGDTDTWQALATVGYRMNENWAFQGGYRYMKAEWDTDLGQSSLEFSGPIVGVTYRF